MASPNPQSTPRSTPAPTPAPAPAPTPHSMPASTPRPTPGPGARPSHWGLDPVLLEVLACPAEHHAPLAPGRPGDAGAPSLTCTDCGRVFPIRDGIPVLLLDEADRWPEPDGAAGATP